MSGAKSPRGEQPGRHGARWETELRFLGEVVCPDDDGDNPFGRTEFQPTTAGPDFNRPIPYRANRATRRAAAREARRTTSDTSNGLRGPQAGSSGLDETRAT